MKKQTMSVQMITDTIFSGPVTAVYEKNMRKLCLFPYHNHPRGCPNYGKHDDCPPKVCMFPRIFFEKEVYIAAVSLDFEKYLTEKRFLHPTWTERALRNSRHWQGHVRAILKKFATGKKQELPQGYELISNPEAMGINLTRTCAQAGIFLEWPPEKTVYKIILFAKRK